MKIFPKFAAIFLIFISLSAYAEDHKAEYSKLLIQLKTLFLGPGKNSTHYVFTPEELIQVAKMGEGSPLAERWPAMLKKLQANHPNVYLAPTLHWIFNQAGNVTAEIAIVYASTHEYVAFFGTPIGGRGFSGRYPLSTVYDIMVAGTMQDFKPGDMQAELYNHPGDMETLLLGIAKGMVYADNTWMIDYSRGDLSSMFPYGIIAPALFQTLDYQNAIDEIKDAIDQILHNG